MSEKVVYVDFNAGRRLTQTVVRRPTPSDEAIAMPPHVATRDQLKEAAVRAIIEAEVISELPIHAYPDGDPDEISPFQRLDEAVSALSHEEEDWAWDEAFKRLAEN